MTEVLLLLAALVLIAACGLFVAAEFAFLTVDRAAVARAAESGDRRAQGTQSALKHLSTQLSGAQVGITVTNLAIGFLAEPAIGRLLDGPLQAAGLPSGGATGVSIALALVISTLLTMVFGELVPKNLAIALPLATANAVQGFQRGFTKVMALPIRALNGSANFLLRTLFKIEPQEELASARSADELLSLVRRSAEQGTLESETAVMVQRSLAFADRRAQDVMTPRVRVHSLHAEDTLVDLLHAVHATGRSRFPVVTDSIDDLVGVVHARQVLLTPPAQRAAVRLREVAETAHLVPETLHLDALLDRLKGSTLQLAVVVDEFGGVAGVATLEDLIEEIVGEVVDEHDAEAPSARQAPDGSWSLSGLLRPDEASRHLGVPLPEGEDYETIAGLVTEHLGRVPGVGDAVDIEVQAPMSVLDDDDDPATPPVRAVALEVEAMDGLRVATLRATLLRHQPADPSSQQKDVS